MSLPQQVANLFNNISATEDFFFNNETTSIFMEIKHKNITEEIFSNSYLTYLIIGQYWFSLICYFISMFLFFKIINDFLIKAEETNLRFTPSISIFVSMAATTSLFSFIHLLYLTFNWRSEENIYNPKTLFWSGVTQIIFQISFSCTLFFQTIDRIIHLFLSHRYSYRLQKALAFSSLFVAFIIVFPISIYAIPLQLKYSSKKLCRTSSCQIFDGPGIIFLNTRFALSAINAIGGAMFFVIFRIYLQRKKESRRLEHHRQHKRMRTPMITIAIILEFIFAFCPFCIAFYTFRIFGVNLSTFTGQYSQFFNAIEFLFLGMVYYRAFKGIHWRQNSSRSIPWAVPIHPPPARRASTVTTTTRRPLGRSNTIDGVIGGN